MNTQIKITILIFILVGVGAFWYFQSRSSFPISNGETVLQGNENKESSVKTAFDASTGIKQIVQTQREILVTDGVKHSIPLSEILSGGLSKDGIPSIDAPKFILASEATFLNDSDPGLGLTINGESRFYPYRILVWHEIVNDKVAHEPVLVTYCPLCATGIVFDRRVDGEVQEFGVSGRLWQSNLLMYNRSESEDNESLWSQVLGEAVLGVNTGEKLTIVRSDIVRFGDWKRAHPNTKILSQDTGAVRSYGRDPYGDYYTSESVSFGATFTDTRLHPKALVHGIEIGGQYKAYHDGALSGSTSSPQAGTITDTFGGMSIVVTKTDLGEIRFTANGEPLASIPVFWFSWLAVHPKTELFK
ncbi:hypothetical protein COW82_02965 [Candidatus Campbellbacteria bacterium CG22_combo_CG10-13_8_21_14_all_43_18]|uniref:DUF3179 domain-containing protein n=1 Tax=Candidatus Campbellbacteria bacterium CG22_combo_CG10-13_8_21_14_all_43_18 TaxID=1974530 RepID=A0A2H0DXF7_9BACT|nr:MAG: hypothetical protein COW82_02965 [Candidatus Campbellbacteria bacterium CG22_combo_CG10-13_8_21_14_all_43_18]